MTNANDARKAHKILDDLFKGNMVLDEEREFLRSFLPGLPKQKTLEEITEQVYDAWTRTNYNEWAGNIDNPNILLEEWLVELHVQLKGLKDTPAAVPELPAGMRIAVHAVYGRVVVSPVVDDDGTCKIFHLSTHAGDGSDYCWAPIDSLTFIDYEPAKPTHPEFLETEADYQKAPEGTIVACDDSSPWHKFDSVWLSTAVYEGNNAKNMTGIIRRVLRWGE